MYVDPVEVSRKNSCCRTGLTGSREKNEKCLQGAGKCYKKANLAGLFPHCIFCRQTETAHLSPSGSAYKGRGVATRRMIKHIDGRFCLFASFLRNGGMGRRLCRPREERHDREKTECPQPQGRDGREGEHRRVVEERDARGEGRRGEGRHRSGSGGADAGR